MLGRLLLPLVTLVCWISPVSGMSVDLASLAQDRVLRTPLGDLATLYWSRRDDYPAIAGLVPSAELEFTGLAITGTGDGALSFHTNGRADWEPRYDWAPLLVFRPKVAGRYALGGRLTLRNAGPEADVGQVTWVVARVTEQAFETIASGTGGAGTQVDLATVAELRAIPLAGGQSLGLSVWRQAWHWNGGGRLDGLTIERVRRP